jgi:hypothetical protein
MVQDRTRQGKASKTVRDKHDRIYIFNVYENLLPVLVTTPKYAYPVTLTIEHSIFFRQNRFWHEKTTSFNSYSWISSGQNVKQWSVRLSNKTVAQIRHTHGKDLLVHEVLDGIPTTFSAKIARYRPVFWAWDVDLRANDEWGLGKTYYIACPIQVADAWHYSRKENTNYNAKEEDGADYKRGTTDDT